MRESKVISILIHATQLILWGCLTVVVLLPNNSLFAQDPDDVEDVEEFFGDDDDYDDYEDEDEYLDDDEYEDDEEFEDD